MEDQSGAGAGSSGGGERARVFLFAALQSFVTAGVASGVASARATDGHGFIGVWLVSWLYAWGVMLPIVLLLAPVLRRIADAIVVAATPLLERRGGSPR